MAASSTTLQHVGEWELELRADTREELFEELARVIARAADPSEPPPDCDEWERIALTARDDATLLVDWANELIGRGEIAARAYGFVRSVGIAPAPSSVPGVQVTAEVCGTPVDAWRSPLKAATYHGVALGRQGEGWRARLLLDV